ncbi:glutamate--cysteine ligase [Candidatus Peregrinibacteria bacterium CG_4_9_14_0_2_um_filter_53_11]|nr:MAG: glutamate--cysteine ligase [Candidatus Peregrinibacteria bacterium CG_4_9_14_0_2_um_filter_53_11]
MLPYLVEQFKKHDSKIQEWFSYYESQIGSEPIYASVDLRNAGYKIAPVDTNIFPAGFNNLCPSFQREATRLFKEALSAPGIDRKLLGGRGEIKKILILAEEHTRNLFYFDHLHALKSIVEAAGIEVVVGSLSTDLPAEENFFENASGKKVTIARAAEKNGKLQTSTFLPDLILINNDFSAGLPEVIRRVKQPMVPTPHIGWHRRKKSDHFTHYRKFIENFAEHIEIDPWLMLAEFSMVDELNLSESSSTERLAAEVDRLLAIIREKHHAHGVSDEPFVFVKNNAGTYGMAIMTAHSGDEFLQLNKKQRKNMKTGKGSQSVTSLIIQEGLVTVDRFQGLVAEPVVYLVNNQACGGFFRLHDSVDERGNLNQPGMRFSKLCFHELTGYENVYEKACDMDCLSMVYKYTARIASLAAGCEINSIPLHEI